MACQDRAVSRPIIRSRTGVAASSDVAFPGQHAQGDPDRMVPASR
jgi:hypothetical protein